MNILVALLPHKHVKFSESLLAIAGVVRGFLIEPRTVEELLTLLKKEKMFKFKINITYVVFALDILFILKQIKLLENGRIVAVKNEID